MTNVALECVCMDEFVSVEGLLPEKGFVAALHLASILLHGLVLIVKMSHELSLAPAGLRTEPTRQALHFRSSVRKQNMVGYNLNALREIGTHRTGKYLVNMKLPVLDQLKRVKQFGAGFASHSRLVTIQVELVEFFGREAGLCGTFLTVEMLLLSLMRLEVLLKATAVVATVWAKFTSYPLMNLLPPLALLQYDSAPSLFRF